MGMVRHEATCREEAASIVVPGVPACSPEDPSFCPKGNREPWKSVQRNDAVDVVGRSDHWCYSLENDWWGHD